MKFEDVQFSIKLDEVVTNCSVSDFHKLCETLTDKQALELSIKKWMTLAAGVLAGNIDQLSTWNEGGRNTCALCGKYNNFTQWEPGCTRKYGAGQKRFKRCPVFTVTGSPYCENTPYEARHLRGDYILQAVIDEVRFLRSILNKKRGK